MTDPKPKSMAALISDLEAAKVAYVEFTQALEAARRKQTEAINHLNQCQKDVDAAYLKLKSNSPRGSNWAEEGRGV